LPKPNSPFCSVNASRIQFEDAVKFNRDFRHTKFLTLPLYDFFLPTPGFPHRRKVHFPLPMHGVLPPLFNIP
ncbi:MAG: hypothetical protein Q7J20_11735, partial [Candidatus Nitrotoga sp.]|nr:hypothetical protein [Candidatus Nitrotoga sp.]